MFYSACFILLLSGCNSTNTAKLASENQLATNETTSVQTTTEKQANPVNAPSKNDASKNEQATEEVVDPNAPSFTNVSVHDPSVIKVGDAFYVFGSHLQSAKTTDLMNWELVSSGATNGNKLIPNVKEEMAEALAWAQTDTFWAGDVIQLADGKFYMYYCNCKGDSPLGDIGLAVSDNIDGPYKDQGMFIKSGMWGQTSLDGTVYDATVHPNAVDPDTFFDNDGNLWMVYGSYSGGIFILKMDPQTGLPLPDQGYGKKLLGANHSRIEGPYILYSPETDYYYLFLSFGGLDVSGGYNIRVCRSKTPDGPFYDALGNDMIDCHGKTGTFFDDVSIAPFGVKLMGNYKFAKVDGEPSGIATGYVSPGHNSAYYDEEMGKYFLFFHTRFPSKGETYEVRVHQLFFNEEGWPVVAPQRYTGETIEAYKDADIVGDFKYVNHGKDISSKIKASIMITLNDDYTISGSLSGTWLRVDDHTAEISIEGVTYKGVFLKEYDTATKQTVMTFSALSADGTAIWGSKVAIQMKTN